MYEEYNENIHSVQHDEEQVYEFSEEKFLSELKMRQDSFLDVLSHYLKNKKDTFVKCVLERKTIELELLDPSFNYTIE